MLLSLLLACSPPPEVDHVARRAALREQVRTELGAAYEAPLAVGDPARLAEGADIYTKSCSKCHGAKLDGLGPRAAMLDPRPAPLIGPEGGFYSPAGMVWIVRNGAPGTGMAPWSRAFSDAQIDAVVGWILVQETSAQGD
jgi:mono/diheme cytochrome c family protein